MTARSIRCVSLPGLLIALAGACAAQAPSPSSLVVQTDPAAFACLQVGDGSASKPVYPEREAALRNDAVVRVRLTFERPDQAPRVEPIFNSAGPAFLDAVVDFARAYRLPCLRPEGPPQTALQEFQFVAHDGRKVVSGPLRDDGRAAAVTNCLAGNDAPPNFPPRDMRAGRSGTVVVKMVFDDPAAPPQATVLFDGGSGSFAAAATAHVQRYRLPCLTAERKPLSAMQVFIFRNVDAPAFALKDMDIQTFVGALDDLRHHPARFDFTSMGCPFDVRMQLLQPYAPNLVGEVERSDPNRREFVEWLAGVALKLPPEASRQVIGQTMQVFVPCAVLDLT